MSLRHSGITVCFLLLAARLVSAVYSDAFLQMFEWTWEDLGRECERMGEDGWMAVQTSAVFAHRQILHDEEFGDGDQDLAFSW
jgi:hypothetical protein